MIGRRVIVECRSDGSISPCNELFAMVPLVGGTEGRCGPDLYLPVPGQWIGAPRVVEFPVRVIGPVDGGKSGRGKDLGLTGGGASGTGDRGLVGTLGDGAPPEDPLRRRQPPPANGSAALRLCPGPDSRMAGDIAAFGRHVRAVLGYCEPEARKAVRAAEELTEAKRWGNPAQITQAEALDWLTAGIESGGGGARKTAKNKLSRLKAFGAYLKTAGLVEADPFAGLAIPRAGKGRRRKGARAFAWDEQNRIIRAAIEAEAGLADKRRWMYERLGPLRSTFYLFLSYTGLRYSEAGRQRWEDIDLDAKVMWLTGDKSDRGDALSLPDPLVAVLRVWAEWSRGDGRLWSRGDAPTDRKGRLFPRVPSHHSLTGDMAAAGVPGVASGKRGQWHRFRKGLATEYARLGFSPAVAQKNLRHDDADLTLCCYTDLELSDQAKAAAKLPLLGKVPQNSLDSRGDVVEDVGARLNQMTGTTHPSQNTRPPTTESSVLASQTSAVGIADGRGGRVFPLGCELAEWSRGESTPRPERDRLLAEIIAGLNHNSAGLRDALALLNGGRP